MIKKERFSLVKKEEFYTTGEAETHLDRMVILLPILVLGILLITLLFYR